LILSISWRTQLKRSKRLTVQEYCDGVLKGDRMILAKAITIVESKLPSDQYLAQQLIQRILVHTGTSIRVGITGVPGVGKSTLLDNLGMFLVGKGHKVAILAIDPSSQLSGGSILGDKTRMVQLASDERAFIRPSPSQTELGGVARKTRETLLLCEAAGFDVVIIETVGVGQSEVVVANMVDTFVALMLPGAGDELQGIKKGLLEMADIIAVNKCDGDNELSAKRSKREYESALHYVARRHSSWNPIVSLVSGLHNIGLKELWELILQHRSELRESGDLQRLRSLQQKHWMWSMVSARLMSMFMSSETVQEHLKKIEKQVMLGEKSVSLAVEELLELFQH
jgi:LAO/AO transport system kinase